MRARVALCQVERCRQSGFAEHFHDQMRLAKIGAASGKQFTRVHRSDAYNEDVGRIDCRLTAQQYAFEARFTAKGSYQHAVHIARFRRRWRVEIGVRI